MASELQYLGVGLDGHNYYKDGDTIIKGDSHVLLVDKYGDTAKDWGKHQFECEYCAECGGDWDDHDYVLILGSWFARCRDENIEKMETNPEWRRIQDEILEAPA